MQAAARIYYSRREYWIESLRDAKPVLHNCNRVNSPVPLRADDEIFLGEVVLRVSDPCPESLSPILEIVGQTGSFETLAAVNLRRVVLLQKSLRISSRPPCHLGLAGIDPDV